MQTEPKHNTMNKRKTLPVGLQSFREIIENDYLYVDKTEIIYRLINDYKYIFLSRPRRFGKSLLTNTLHEYFAGEKELFKGLAMEHLETKWTKHPVLHFGLSTCKNLGPKDLEAHLSAKLSQYEEKYVSKQIFSTLGGRLEYLVQKVYEKTKEKVVILIDEYDAPLLDVLHTDFLEDNRNVMRNFYSPLKDLDYYLRCVFITGITKFSQLSIFSEINNITNVSMYDCYSNICGITQDELETQLKDYVGDMGEKMGISFEETLKLLKDNYDGYHFSADCEDLYNPYSLLASLKGKSILSKWFESGTPTYLINMLKNYDFPPIDMDNYMAVSHDFDVPMEGMTSPIPFFYHSGYLTIKRYDNELGLYVLGYPNKEVSEGLSRALFPMYLNVNASKSSEYCKKLRIAIIRDDMEEAMQVLRSYLSFIPYNLLIDKDKEKSYQLALFVIFNSLGFDIATEVMQSQGRADIIIKNRKSVIIIELKVDGSSAQALKQIEDKNYALPYLKDGRKIYKIGANIDSETRTLRDWEIVFFEDK